MLRSCHSILRRDAAIQGAEIYLGTPINLKKVAHSSTVLRFNTVLKTANT